MRRTRARPPRAGAGPTGWSNQSAAHGEPVRAMIESMQVENQATRGTGKANTPMVHDDSTRARTTNHRTSTTENREEQTWLSSTASGCGRLTGHEPCLSPRTIAAAPRLRPGFCPDALAGTTAPWPHPHARSSRRGTVLTRFRLARHSALDDEEASEPPVDGVLLDRDAGAAKRQFKPPETTALERQRPRRPTRARLPVRPGDAALRQYRPSSHQCLPFFRGDRGVPPAMRSGA